MIPFVARLGTGSLHGLIARTPAELRVGLSTRARLGPNEAMLFDMGGPSTVPFTLRDTAVALDVLFLDDAMRVIGGTREVPARDPDPVVPPGPYRYALETRAGWTARHGVVIGTRLLRVPVFV